MTIDTIKSLKETISLNQSILDSTDWNGLYLDAGSRGLVGAQRSILNRMDDLQAVVKQARFDLYIAEGQLEADALAAVVVADQILPGQLGLPGIGDYIPTLSTDDNLIEDLFPSVEFNWTLGRLAVETLSDHYSFLMSFKEVN